MSRTAAGALRVVIVLMLGGLLLMQVLLLPAVAYAVVADAPEVAWVGALVLPASIGVVAMVQVALVAVWPLLGMVDRDTVFSTAALKYVDVIVGAVVVATVLVTAMNVLLWQAEIDPLLVFVLLAAGTVGGAGLALLLVVMRALLARAAALRLELSEVV